MDRTVALELCDDLPPEAVLAAEAQLGRPCKFTEGFDLLRGGFPDDPGCPTTGQGTTRHYLCSASTDRCGQVDCFPVLKEGGHCIGPYCISKVIHTGCGVTMHDIAAPAGFTTRARLQAAAEVWQARVKTCSIRLECERVPDKQHDV